MGRIVFLFFLQGAYLLPVIHVLLRDRNGQTDDDPRISRPQAIVLSPTRELALQIYELAKQFVQGSYLKPRTLYGGTSRNLLNQRLKVKSSAFGFWTRDKITSFIIVLICLGWLQHFNSDSGSASRFITKRMVGF